jgi:hypothetical protein
MKKNTFMFHNIELPKPSFNSPKFDNYQLKIGKRKIQNNKIGAKRLKKNNRKLGLLCITSRRIF